MDVKVSMLNQCSIIHVNGRLDTITAGDFESKILSHILPKVRLVIDCSSLDYISSTGLRVFLVAQKKVSETGGKLKLCSLQPNIKEIFDISGFSSIFSIHDTLESATK